MEQQEKVVKLGPVWRLIGPTFWLVAAAYPFLVRFVELRELTPQDILTPLLVGAVGLWFAFEASRRAVANDQGIAFVTLFSRNRVPWSELAGVDLVRANFVFRDRSGSKHVVSMYANGAAALADETTKRCSNRA